MAMIERTPGWVHIDVVCLGVSDKAFHFQTSDRAKRFWVPKSVIARDDPDWDDWEEGDFGTISIKDWFAEKEGLV